MTHPTDEELIARLRVGVPTMWEKQAADRIEALMKDRDQAWEVAHAATDRGMRAEAALAAQIEVDAGIAAAETAMPSQYNIKDQWRSGIGDEVAAAIRAQPHDRSALDRMLAEASEKALRKAIIEGMRIAIFTPIEQVPAAIDDAIRALIEADHAKT